MDSLSTKTIILHHREVRVVPRKEEKNNLQVVVSFVEKEITTPTKNELSKHKTKNKPQIHLKRKFNFKKVSLPKKGGL